MGNLNTKWLKEFYKSCGASYDDSEKQPAKRKKVAETKHNSTQFCILYPTKAQVAISDLSGSEVVCLAEKYWESDDFPKQLFCNLIPKESSKVPHLFHSKVKYFLKLKNNFLKLLYRLIKTDKRQDGWLYAGSHNFSSVK